MATQFKRETWNIRGKRRYVFVARNKGRIQTWKLAKGLKQKGLSKKALQSQLKRRGSLNTTILSRDVFKSGVVRITSKKREDKQKRTQVGVELKIRRNKDRRFRTFTGYSNKGKSDHEGIKQARGRAFKVAIDSGYIDYTDIEDMSITVKERVFYIAYK